MQGKKQKITLSNGEQFDSIKKACESLGLNYRTVMARRKRGLSLESQFMVDIICNECSVKLNKENKYRDERLCKDCGKIVKARREKKHEKKRRETERLWRLKNKDKVEVYRRKEKELGLHYYRKYGLKKEDVDKLFSNGCECCGSMNRLVVDHCHDSNKVRGCLCHGCNVSLGFAKDDPEILFAIHKYAKKWMHTKIKNAKPRSQ